MTEANTPNNTPDYLAVGRVLGPHGVRGEVKMELHTDFPERLTAGRTLYLGQDKRPVRLAAVRPHQANLLLTLDDVKDRAAVEGLKGEWLYVPASEAAPLGADEYFVYQIIGLQVVDVNGRQLGTVSEVLFTGSNDVYVVGKPEGGELLIPALDDVVKTVDLERKLITVELPAGLEDKDSNPAGL